MSTQSLSRHAHIIYLREIIILSFPHPSYSKGSYITFFVKM